MATFCINRCPSQGHNLSPELNGGGGAWAPNWMAPSQLSAFLGQQRPSHPKQAKNRLLTAKEGKQRSFSATGVLHLCQRSLFVATNSKMCPGNAPEMAQMCVVWLQPAPQKKTKMGPYLGLHGSECNSKGPWSTCSPLLLVISNPQNSPNQRPDSSRCLPNPAQLGISPGQKARLQTGSQCG